VQLEASLAGWLDKTRPGELTGDVFRAELKAGRCLLILDGVDEVPESRGEHLPRRNLLTGLADALPAWRKAGNWLLLTSRPYGLEAEDQRRLGLPTAELAELPRPLMRLFVRRWFDAVDPANAVTKADGLLTHLAQRDDLAEMRANPMLLTALCVKYDEGRRLPQDFYALYDAVVRQVLYKRCNTENERDQARNRLAAIALGMHRGDAGAPKETPEAEVTVEEVDRILATLAEVDWVSEAGAAGAGAKRELLLSDSGLLLPRDNRRAAEVLQVELRLSNKFLKEYRPEKLWAYLGVFGQIVRDGQARGLFRTAVDPFIGMWAFFGALDELAMQWVLMKPGRRFPIDQAAREVANTFLLGLLRRDVAAQP